MEWLELAVSLGESMGVNVGKRERFLGTGGGEVRTCDWGCEGTNPSLPASSARKSLR